MSVWPTLLHHHSIPTQITPPTVITGPTQSLTALGHLHWSLLPLGDKFGSLDKSANRALGWFSINVQANSSPGELPRLSLDIRIACSITEGKKVIQAQLLEHFHFLSQRLVPIGRLLDDQERL